MTLLSPKKREDEEGEAGDGGQAAADDENSIVPRANRPDTFDQQEKKDTGQKNGPAPGLLIEGKIHGGHQTGDCDDCVQHF
jgi:hypothetical protein